MGHRTGGASATIGIHRLCVFLEGCSTAFLTLLHYTLYACPLNCLSPFSRLERCTHAPPIPYIFFLEVQEPAEWSGSCYCNCTHLPQWFSLSLWHLLPPLSPEEGCHTGKHHSPGLLFSSAYLSTDPLPQTKCVIN